MSQQELHKTQVSILHSLRYARAERFNALMKPTDHTSDTFKFHVRKLVKLGYVEKRGDGQYQLTAKGKDFANNLEEGQRMTRKQPTVSVLLVVRRAGRHSPEFLIFQRARNAFLGYWTCITDAVRWGEAFEERAAKRLAIQTGLQAEFSVHSVRRVRNYDSEKGQLLEDMLFVVMMADDIKGEVQNNYAGGHHEWLTLQELKSKDRYFESTIDTLENLDKPNLIDAQDLYHEKDVY